MLALQLWMRIHHGQRTQILERSHKGGKAMAKRTGLAQGNQGLDKKSKCLAIAEKGIVTGHDFAGFMSALMSDLIGGKVSPNIGNAACNAGGKLLKVVEMQMKYGTQEAGGKVLRLTMGASLVGEQQIAAD